MQRGKNCHPSLLLQSALLGPTAASSPLSLQCGSIPALNSPKNIFAIISPSLQMAPVGLSFREKFRPKISHLLPGHYSGNSPPCTFAHITSSVLLLSLLYSSWKHRCLWGVGEGRRPLYALNAFFPCQVFFRGKRRQGVSFFTVAVVCACGCASAAFVLLLLPLPSLLLVLLLSPPPTTLDMAPSVFCRQKGAHSRSPIVFTVIALNSVCTKKSILKWLVNNNPCFRRIAIVTLTYFSGWLQSSSSSYRPQFPPNALTLFSRAPKRKVKALQPFTLVFCIKCESTFLASIERTIFQASCGSHYFLLRFFAKAVCAFCTQFQ